MSNIKSFGDLGGSGSDDEGPGDFNDYYAGGEKSGQLIRGAPDEKEKKPGGDDIGSLFDKLRKHGAQDSSAGELAGPSGFTGAGRTLTGEPAEAGQRKHVVRFYRNRMFTVDDGPGRSLDDPANLDFMAAIERGECPKELDPGRRDIMVDVHLMRLEEDYVKPKYTAFQGSGRTLAASGGASTSAAAATSSSGGAPEGEWEGVDESKPTTSIQLRLADGMRMVARFNTSHLVSDIRRFIRASRPDLAGKAYQLLTGFPSVPIGDEGATLEAAGLLNAVIIQKT